MSGSILQSRESSASVTGTTIQLAFLSNNVAHNVLWVVAHSDNSGAATHSVADTLVNSYSAALDTLIDADNGNRLSHWSVSDSLAGANTVTITFSVTAQFRAIYISELTGVQNLANDGHNARHQLNPGTATDAVTSNAATNTATAFMIALSNDDSGADNAPAVGTGFTLDKTAWNFLTPGATIEFKSGVAAGSNTATFTAITATDDPNTLMAMFKESVSGVQPVLATSRAGRGPGSGPRMRRMFPQTFPTPALIDTISSEQKIQPLRSRGPGMGPRLRRMVPQRFPEVSTSTTTTLLPTEGAITIAGVAASLTLTIAAIAGAIVINGNAPSISTTLQGVEGSIVIAGNAASTTSILAPTVGAAIISGSAPTLTQTLVGVTGAVTIGGNAPSTTSILAATEGAIVIGGNAPSLVVSSGLSPTEGAITFAGNAPDLLATLLVSEGAISIGGNIPSLIIPTSSSEAFSGGYGEFARRFKTRTEDDLRKEREQWGILPKAAQVVAAVAIRQAAALDLDAEQRLEELERELELAGVQYKARYLELLNEQRQRLIDAEIKGFYEAEQALDEENRRRLLLLLVVLH